ncbi:MAG: UDP-N-acetylmuramoyl-L-alanyl-D-glutamate--2,6-diaminopimelate ligase, partial [Anaerolineae bacterium]|nr:UDP-N-acetylmuramoyl-L-alanyl-D-glutamate--2,6-diaminopimelate ligase [Anaerolineae bacterium]
SPLVGEFNVYNLLAAIAVATSQEVSPGAIQEGVSRMPGVPGRMEKIDLGQPFPVIIDFAHTPNALRHALEIARFITRGRLFVVFGCAGLRDRAKRPMMGEIAGQLADRVIITAEDPRTEDVNAIIEEIARGCIKAGREEGTDFWRIGDRGEAIQFAIDRAEPGDLVIITGKGHAKSMCFETTEYPWSDHEAVREALERCKRK